MTTLLIDVAGWVGMALLIGAYALVTVNLVFANEPVERLHDLRERFGAAL
jgi:hypothetical protein